MLLKNNLVLRLVSVLAIASALGILPVATYAAGPSAAAISKPPAGMGSIVLINQLKGNEALTVSIDGQSYSVPALGGSATNQVGNSTSQGSANQVEFNLAPGNYVYRVSAPDLGTMSKNLTVTAGQVSGLTFQSNPADDVNGQADADESAANVQNGQNGQNVQGAQNAQGVQSSQPAQSSQPQLVTVVGNESDEHESKSEKNEKVSKNSKKDSEQKDSGPDGDETHLVLATPSAVNTNSVDNSGNMNSTNGSTVSNGVNSANGATSTVSDNDDILVTTADLTAQAQ